jgi:histidinol-phosphate aminotransferase
MSIKLAPPPIADARSTAAAPLRPVLQGVAPYAPPAPRGTIDLHLDANEGPAMRADLAALFASLPPDTLRRYSTPATLERLLAGVLGVDPANLIVTAGGDDAIDRVCRICLEPGRELILPSPSFEMIARSARFAGAEVLAPVWSGPFPTQAILDVVSERTALIAIVTPNNPTGAVATRDDLRRISQGAPGAVLLVDLAYTEFADDDLTEFALSLPNTVIIRTLSKAYSLAGLRVGYALAGAESRHLIDAMRTVGLPYPVSALSLAAAEQRFSRREQFLPGTVDRIRAERDILGTHLAALGVRPLPSQANFILAEFPSDAAATWAWNGLGSLGIAVRRFTARSLTRHLRITCPGSEGDFTRLCSALRTTIKPEALLFDMDGVLADVSRSYRRAIILTAQSFGITLTPADIAAAKARGNANNDWRLTQELLAERGLTVPLPEVTARFEAIYHGAADTPGLHTAETLIPPRELLERLARRLPLAIVTGRPRRDCERFLAQFDLSPLFSAVVCMEDAALKPDPAPVNLALSRLGLRAAWLIGDTPDDVRAARAAGVLPIGIAPPGEDPAASAVTLTSAGAAAILTAAQDLEGLLP